MPSTPKRTTANYINGSEFTIEQNERIRTQASALSQFSVLSLPHSLHNLSLELLGLHLQFLTVNKLHWRFNSPRQFVVGDTTRRPFVRHFLPHTDHRFWSLLLISLYCSVGSLVTRISLIANLRGSELTKRETEGEKRKREREREGETGE